MSNMRLQLIYGITDGRKYKFVQQTRKKEQTA